MLTPTVRGVVPPQPLRDEGELPACGGGFGRFENASLTPAVGGSAPAPAASAAAEVFGFTFESIFEDGAAEAGSSILKVLAVARRAPGVTGRMSSASPGAPVFMSPPPRALPAREPAGNKQIGRALDSRVTIPSSSPDRRNFYSSQRSGSKPSCS